MSDNTSGGTQSVRWSAEIEYEQIREELRLLTAELNRTAALLETAEAERDALRAAIKDLLSRWETRLPALPLAARAEVESCITDLRARSSHE